MARKMKSLIACNQVQYAVYTPPGQADFFCTQDLHELEMSHEHAFYQTSRSKKAVVSL